MMDNWSTLANFVRKPMVMGCIGVPHFYESHRIQTHAHLMASESPRQGYSSQNLPSMSSTECGSGVWFEAFQKAIAAIFSRSLQSSIHLEVCDAFLRGFEAFRWLQFVFRYHSWFSHLFSHSNLHSRGFPLCFTGGDFLSASAGRRRPKWRMRWKTSMESHRRDIKRSLWYFFTVCYWKWP